MREVTCPCCEGRGTVPDITPVDLTPNQRKLFNCVKAAKGSIGGHALVERMYGDRHDGGPEDALNAVHVTINQMNKRLAKVNLKIRAQSRGPGSTYRIVPA